MLVTTDPTPQEPSLVFNLSIVSSFFLYLQLAVFSYEPPDESPVE